MQIASPLAVAFSAPYGTTRSLPPCGGGLGRGDAVRDSQPPPPLTPPHKGEGNRLRRECAA
jgi:hypothetical protein